MLHGSSRNFDATCGQNRVNENEPENHSHRWWAAFIGAPLRTTGIGTA
ncbi:hypothetical protein BH23GEM9_BH23GEM9_00350 [soil metagenome]